MLAMSFSHPMETESSACSVYRRGVDLKRGRKGAWKTKLAAKDLEGDDGFAGPHCHDEL